jgi:putative Holliday junction resolvase
MNDACIRSVIGFDYGLKRIGLATGQTITGTASPLLTLQSVQNSPDWKGIASQIREWQPDALIVGIPYPLEGGDSELTRAALNFGRELERRFKLPVYTIDESLSSAEAEEQLRQSTKLAKHNKHEIDKIAAAIIVQSWLNSQ